MGKKNKKKFYPAGNLIKEACYNEYTRMIETYDKIYEKVNIALAFCGVVLMVIISSFDYRKLLQIIRVTNYYEGLVYLFYALASVVSVVCIFCAVIRLMLLLKGKKIMTFDCISARDLRTYEMEESCAAVWLIDKYSRAVQSLEEVVQKKQKKYDRTIVEMVVSIVAFAFAYFLQKGM